jgi:NADH-quinone oxidoreductase subunit H
MEFLVSWLSSFMPSEIARLIVQVFYALILLIVGPTMVLILTYAERKLVGRIQDRIGPNRAGPYGVLQAFADAIKMLTKEDITPTNADRIIYNLAPMLSVLPPLLLLAIIPPAPGVIGADLNIGVIYIPAIGSIGMLAVLMAGWGSNNKYALLGAFRAVAQLISYEIPMVLALISVVLVAGSMSMVDIVRAQDVAFFIALPVSFITFLLASVAEGGRSPFDLLEAESEIVAGYHIEYSGMKFALFFLAEYIHIFAVAALGTTLFFAGWRGPFAEQVPILGIFYFSLKCSIIIFIFFWLRGTLPRFRIDHLLDFAWKFLVPVGLVNVVLIAFVVKLTGAPGSRGIPGTTGLLGAANPAMQTAILLIANIVLIAATLTVMAFVARRSRSPALRRITARS